VKQTSGRGRKWLVNWSLVRELRYADNSQSVSQQTGSSGPLRRKLVASVEGETSRRARAKIGYRILASLRARSLTEGSAAHKFILRQLTGLQLSNGVRINSISGGRLEPTPAQKCAIQARNGSSCDRYAKEALLATQNNFLASFDNWSRSSPCVRNGTRVAQSTHAGTLDWCGCCQRCCVADTSGCFS